MERYSILHTWKEEPDYDSMARSVLDFLLEQEREMGAEIGSEPESNVRGIDSPETADGQQSGEAA